MKDEAVLVATRDQIPIGEGRVFLVDGTTIALFHTHNGQVFATQPLCPHLAGPLSDGLLGGTTLMCPLHDRTFDLETGCGLSHEHMAISTYTTSLDAEGRIWVALEPQNQPSS